MARLLLMALLAMLSSVCGAVGGAETAGNLIIEWTNRFELTSKQQELLHLYTGLEDASLSTEKARTMERQAQQISAALGSMSVRHAKPGELIVSVDKSSVPVITNPSDANVAFTVAIKGEEKRMGTRFASMGHLTFLPPKGSLRVPNLYWSTPRMIQKQ